MEAEGTQENSSEGVGLTLRLQECEGQYSVGELRCFRPPQSASVLDSDGYHNMGLSVHEDAVQLELPRKEINWVQMHW